MRKVTITYDRNSDGNDTLCIEDTNGQWIDVEYVDNTAYFISELVFDDSPIMGSCKREFAEIEALFLMGIPSDVEITS